MKSMKLKFSRNHVEELVLFQLNKGYRISQDIVNDYHSLNELGNWNQEEQIAKYRNLYLSWRTETGQILREIFPSDLEMNIFMQPQLHEGGVIHSDFPHDIGHIIFQKMPQLIERLHRILSIEINRYSDLPISQRIYVEDIDSFIRVRDVNPAMVSHFLKEGRIELSEDEVQLSLESILDVSFHKKDWGGEVNDLYTANMIINGQRRPTAFLLKGNGLKAKEMQISDCGKNGDQLMRLFQSPAEIFVVQYVGPISESVISDVQGKVETKRSRSMNANYLIIDGQDTARLLHAYNKI